VRHKGVIVNFGGDGAGNIFRKDIVKLNAAGDGGLKKEDGRYYKGHGGNKY